MTNDVKGVPQGWTKETQFPTSDRHDYKTSGIGFSKELNGVKIFISVRKDEKLCVLFLVTGHPEDGQINLGEYPYDVEMVDSFVDNHLLLHSTSVEDLHQIYDNLVYFDKDLNPFSQDVLWEASQDKEKSMTLLSEMLFTSRMQTISKCLCWEDAHALRSEAQRNVFRKRLTDPNAATDQFGNIPRFGMKFSNRLFDTYRKFHDEVFELTE